MHERECAWEKSIATEREERPRNRGAASNQSKTPDPNPTNDPKATSTYAYGPPVNETRLPASAMHCTTSPIAAAQMS
jgi:hypothetical protein